MSAQFFPKLSQNYIDMLDDDEYYDITIEVGKDPNVKIFRAHMIILCYRSPYLRRKLSSNKKDNDDALVHITLPNILPESFQIILKYIYGGIISLNEDTSDILKLLVAAEELLLRELVDYLQCYLIENKSDWVEQHFELVYRTSFQFNSLSKLQVFCTDIMAKSPDKIFRSLDFTSLSEKSLISLIKRDELQMKEIEVWEHVLRWGLEKNPTLLPDPSTWSDNDFKMMESTLQHCLPFIRFFSLNSEDFLEKVHPYKKILGSQLYEELLASYLNPNVEPNVNILLPRNRKKNIINSTIVNLNIDSFISRWIDKIDTTNKFTYTRELYLPYKFKLLLRGSRDGFNPDKFHELCDNIPNTVTFVKVKGTDEILGGFNPLIWDKSNEYGLTKDSFIFSFKNKDNLKYLTLSRVDNINKAIYRSNKCGPSFGGGDLRISNKISKDTIHNCCSLNSYEKRISKNEEFSIEDYEVYQIIKESRYSNMLRNLFGIRLKNATPQ